MSFFSQLYLTSPAASVLLSIGLMLLGGLILDYGMHLLHIPSVTGYLLAGILLGPDVLNWIPQPVIAHTEFLSDLALAIIAFRVGEFFSLSSLRKNGIQNIIITLLEAFAASAFVFLVMNLVLHLPFSFSILLAALAAATAPASTIMTIHQLHASGDYVDTLLQVVALDDIAALLAYSAAIALACLRLQGGNIHGGMVIGPLLVNLGFFILGGALGYLLSRVLHRLSSDNQLILLLLIQFLFCAAASLAQVSPLLGCMAMGSVYRIASKRVDAFRRLEGAISPILLLFFVRSGLGFQLHALISAQGAIQGVSLISIGIVYFFVRILGKYLGAYCGCLLCKKPKSTRNYLGFSLVPQAGVSIGLAVLASRIIGGQTGSALQTVILASSVLYELIGPSCTKIGLTLAHAFPASESKISSQKI